MRLYISLPIYCSQQICSAKILVLAVCTGRASKAFGCVFAQTIYIPHIVNPLTCMFSPLPAVRRSSHLMNILDCFCIFFGSLTRIFRAKWVQWPCTTKLIKERNKQMQQTNNSTGHLISLFSHVGMLCVPSPPC